MPDPHRPRTHFLPPHGWINDPNGLIALERDGQTVYHLFYQHNPLEARWDRLCWGHATSTDLLHWEHQPIALEPGGPGTPDDTGCWSGCTVIRDGQPVIVYTGSHDYNPSDDSSSPSICLAFGSDNLETWQKFQGNPVLSPPDFDWTGFRDPGVWRDGDRWLMTVGAGIRGRGATVMLYESADLERWTTIGPILTADELPFPPLEGQTHYGTVWECPQLIPFEGFDALLYCGWEHRRGLYSGVFTGHFANQRFTPTHSAYLDPGEFFAPLAMRDPQGRTIVYGWLPERRDEAAQLESGWSGTLSHPRLLTIEDGRVAQHPAPELEALRDRHRAWQDLELGHLELGEFGPSFELKLKAKGDLRLTLGHDARVTLEASGRFGVTTAHGERHLNLPAASTYELHVFFDASVLEVFAHGQAITRRIYPDGPPAIALEAPNGARLERLDVWTQKPLRGDSG